MLLLRDVGTSPINAFLAVIFVGHISTPVYSSGALLSTAVACVDLAAVAVQGGGILGRPLGLFLSISLGRGGHITGICARGSRSLGPHCASLDSGGILNCRHPMFRGSEGHQVCVFSGRYT
jgi:hypothetical protein